MRPDNVLYHIELQGEELGYGGEFEIDVRADDMILYAGGGEYGLRLPADVVDELVNVWQNRLPKVKAINVNMTVNEEAK